MRSREGSGYRQDPVCGHAPNPQGLLPVPRVPEADDHRVRGSGIPPFGNDDIHVFRNPAEHLLEGSASPFEDQALLRSLDQDEARAGFGQGVGVPRVMIQGQVGHVAGFESRNCVAPLRQLADEGGADRGFAAVFQARYTDQTGAIFRLIHDSPILARPAETRIPPGEAVGAAPRRPAASRLPRAARAPARRLRHAAGSRLLAGAGHNRVHC